MKACALLVVLLLLGGCTAFKPVELPPDQLRTALIQGEIIQVGDTIRVGTRDGNTHQLRVQQLTEQQIQGESITLAVADVETLERLKPTVVGYAVMVPVAAGVWALMSALIVAVLISVGG